jgi:hypothetical protein
MSCFPDADSTSCRMWTTVMACRGTRHFGISIKIFPIVEVWVHPRSFLVYFYNLIYICYMTLEAFYLNDRASARSYFHHLYFILLFHITFLIDPFIRVFRIFSPQSFTLSYNAEVKYSYHLSFLYITDYLLYIAYIYFRQVQYSDLKYSRLLFRITLSLYLLSTPIHKIHRLIWSPLSIVHK